MVHTTQAALAMAFIRVAVNGRKTPVTVGADAAQRETDLAKHLNMSMWASRAGTETFELRDGGQAIAHYLGSNNRANEVHGAIKWNKHLDGRPNKGFTKMAAPGTAQLHGPVLVEYV